MNEEVRNGNLLDAGRIGLDWDSVLDRVRVHLAAVPAGGGLVEPVGMSEAICQTKDMLAMIDLASWEDHIDELLRPKLETLLITLETARREFIQERNST